jgi:chromate transporter
MHWKATGTVVRMEKSKAEPRKLQELAILFLRLGFIGFGGPAAHIAMMEDEVVKRRKWITHEHFLDLLGVTNLIPGPNSTEMAIQIGLVQAGWRGLIIAGVCFIIPATAITLALAYLYVAFGSLPQLTPLIAGIRPAIIAIILGAVYRLGKPIVKKDKTFLFFGIIVAILAFFRINEILLLFSGGIVAIVWANRHRFRNISTTFLATCFLFPLTIRVAETIAPSDVLSLPALGLYFLKIGSVLYGGGYVLVAFLQTGLVETKHWLTQTQLLDAIAVGQFTPGPVLSTAAFIGYVLLGIPGAVVATIGIFLPSFFFVLIISPFIPKLRSVPSVRTFLDGVNASALGLMLAVCVTLGMSTLSNPLNWLIFLGAGSSILLWNFNPAWLVIGSALVSLLATTIRF